MESGANDPRLPQDLRLIRRLGESPLSLVFLVEDAGGLRYALKVLRPSVARDPRILERWRREARLLEEFDHPNLVHCYGAPEVEGRPALLLEFIDGSSLREKLRAGPLGWEQAARFGVQIARALHYMHRHGAIHRDVKPHNVLIDLERGAILADLGLVRREEDPTMTRQGAALGSPAYMSPEQARDPSEVDEQADVYSLGATLFHSLSGKPPFLGQGVGEVIHRVLHEDPEDLPQGVPPTLAKVVLTAMAKNPERRYARVRDFGSDLGRVLLGYPPRLLTRYRRRRQMRSLSIAAAALLLAAGSFWWRPWSRDTNHDPPQDVSTTETPATGPSLATSDPAVSSPPSSTPELRAEPFFSAWHSPYQRRFQTSLANGQFRDALAECSAIQRAAVPPDAPLGFLDLRRDWILDAESQVTAVAERTAGQALDLLIDQVSFARTSIDRGNFDGEAWSGRVLDLWRRAGLRVTDLPLHPGSPDPVGRLQMTQVVLENEAEQVRIRLALGMVAAVRKNTAQLLRAGSFAEARLRWDRVDPVVFLHSFEARADLARIEELLALNRRLQTRFRELAGQHVELLLRSGGTLQGRLVTDSSGSGHAVDYLGQARVEVDLLDLDVAFSVSWLLGREQAWLQAQLSWCQDDLTAAIATMRPLATPDLPTEWRPEFWVDQWQQERASGVSDPGITGDGQFLSAVDPLSPQQQLIAALQARLPDVHLRQLGDEVELDLGSLELHQGWHLDLRQELRSWRVVAWRLAWQLGLDQTAPSKLTWLGDIVLTRNGSAPAQMWVSGRRLSGYGIVPGLGIQVLSWDGEQLQLDGIPLSPWQPPTARLTRFVADGPDGFLFDSVRLRFAPR